MRSAGTDGIVVVSGRRVSVRFPAVITCPACTEVLRLSTGCVFWAASYFVPRTTAAATASRRPKTTRVLEVRPASTTLRLGRASG